MIEFEHATELILERVGTTGTEERRIEDSAGTVVAEDVVAQSDMAPYRNSAMDGFAVCAEWLTGSRPERPTVLPIGDTVFAGDDVSVLSGRPFKVMTGGMVPEPFDAVVPFEHTEFDESEVRFPAAVDRGANIRLPGEDFARGDVLLTEGTLVGEIHIGVLAAAGLQSLRVYRKPSVRVVGTGDELVRPGHTLKPGQTYDINTFTLQALTERWAGELTREDCVPDREEEITRVLQSTEDVIVTSGGVSAGERDLIVSTAESCGWETIFHKVRIKPGKPVYFASRNGQYLFGLPGNPLSAAVTCAIFVVPALKKMAGYPEFRLRFEQGRLAPGEVRRSGRKVFWPGRIFDTNDGLAAAYSPKRSSAAISALLNTDGLIVQSATGDTDQPDRIEVIRWSHVLGR